MDLFFQGGAGDLFLSEDSSAEERIKSLLGAAACLSLRDAKGAAARPLKRGLRAHALAHVALAAARPFVDGMGLYPAATACAPAWAATLLAYGVLLDGVRRC